MAENKINTKISVALQYTNDNQTEKEIRGTSTFTIPTNKIKYFELTITKQWKELYKNNFKSLKKEMEDNI